MNKLVSIAAILSLLLLGSMLMAPALAYLNPPTDPVINRPMRLDVATIEGGTPETVDPAWAYDTASGEMLQNVYDTLFVFDGEHTETYLGNIATGYLLEEIDQVGPSGQLWHWRYTIYLNATADHFAPPYNYPLDASDVEFSIERELVQDRSSGPQWMFYEPLLNTWGAEGLGNGDLGDVDNVKAVGKLIDESVVVVDPLTVQFNVMFDGSYAPFLQILCQCWASIMSKEWVQNEVITGAGRPDWDGNWGDYSGWVAYHNPGISPLDTPTPMMYGSGPFMLQTLDYNAMYWELHRNTAWWRNWPCDYPAMAAAKPAGYADIVSETWAFAWAARKAMFLAGDVDFCAVPREFLSEIYQIPAPPYKPPNYPLDGIRCIQPLPTLTVDAFFMTFHINPATLYGPIYADGVYDELGIPADFFTDIHTRKGFAQAFDMDTYIAQAFLGEAFHPATAIIPGLLYYDPTVVGWSYNMAAATAEFMLSPEWTTGFTMTLLWNTGNLPRQTACNLLEASIESINPLFHINVITVDWRTYLRAAVRQQLPMFSIGWVADYPDPHNFAFAFYHTYGSFSIWQQYSNATMDTYIGEGISLPNGAARQAKYRQIQELAVADCPSFTLTQVIGRHFERDWVVGWYYNPVYPGNFYGNFWKWYYIPHALYNGTTVPAVTQPISFSLPADCNYDGKIDMKDIGTASKSFGADAGPPVHPRWVFRVDFNNDRKIDMKDIGYVSKYFGKSSPKWVPTP